MAKQKYEEFSLKLDFPLSPISSKSRQLFTETLLKQRRLSNYHTYYIMNISKDLKFIAINTCYEDDLN